MKIRGKTVFVYDIEVFPNVFILTAKNTESGNKVVYEISDRKNDLPYIRELFTNKHIMYCGFNVLHYDAPIVSFLLLHYDELINKPVWEICKAVKTLSDEIVTSKDGQYSSWSKYKYADLFPSLDLLTMLWSSKLRVGLKELQVTMNYHNVEEYSGDFDKTLWENEIDNAISYCYNDIESTEELLNRCKGDIDLRLAIEDEYKIKALNKDGVNLGMEIIKQRYLAETGLQWKDIRDLRSPCDYLCLNDIIFDFIEFKTPVLQSLLKEVKNLCIDPNDNSFERQFYIGNTKHTLSLGGAHSVNTPEVFKLESDEVLGDFDVTSMYPSIILEHRVYPEHLGKAFLDVYGKIRSDRVAAKREGNKIVDATLKLALNGLTGNFQSPFSWVYSPKTVLTIRLNGQLMLFMLAEAFNEAGARIIQSNTDGVFIKYKKEQEPTILTICKDWENKTKLGLEADYFESFFQYAINDYIGVKKGYSETKDPKLIKKKGMFIDTVTLGKGMAPMIIPEAINKYFVDGIDPHETVYNCKDILKFCTYQKVAKKFEVLYGGKKVQHINRYYMSMDGKELVKKDPLDTTGRKPTALCAGSVVTIYNTFDDKPIEERKINYKYYLGEIYKIIEVLEVNQLSLF